MSIYQGEYHSTKNPEVHPKKTFGEIIDGIIKEPTPSAEELLNDKDLVESIIGLVDDGVLKSEYEKNVSHPSHYADRKIEVIDYIEDCGFLKGFCLGNVIKYVSRAGRKNPDKEVEDLEKAAWYLNHFIEYLRKKS